MNGFVKAWLVGAVVLGGFGAYAAHALASNAGSHERTAPALMWWSLCLLNILGCAVNAAVLMIGEEEDEK